MLRNHWDGILAYFDDRRTSGPVEGLNNKIRTLMRRGYGIRNVANLWTRALLDVNLCCAVDSEHLVYRLSSTLDILKNRSAGLHYKSRSGLKRSGSSRRRASRIRLGSPSGRATRRRTSV